MLFRQLRTLQIKKKISPYKYLQYDVDHYKSFYNKLQQYKQWATNSCVIRRHTINCFCVFRDNYTEKVIWILKKSICYQNFAAA